MKILAYMSTPGGLTGAPRRLLNLALILNKARIEVCIAAPSDTELLQAARMKGQEVVILDPVGPLACRQGGLFSEKPSFRLRVGLALVLQNFRLLWCIFRRNIDAVWLRGSKGIAFGVLGVALSRRPLIWDVDYELPSRGPIRLLHRLGLWASSAVVFQYTAAPGRIFGNELAESYRERFRAIIPGIDLPSLRPLAERRKDNVQTGGGPFVLLQVGTICDRKNQALTLDALELAREQGLDGSWMLWLAYDEIQDPGFEERLRENGLENNVRLLGWRADVKELMAQASVLVMPSKDEGVPNAVQEAMAIGLPVLVSSAGGMPEIVADGENGWVLDMDDPVAWGQRILWCWKHPSAREEIGRNASEYAFNHFGTERWGTEYARVIEESATSPASTSTR